LAAGRSEQIFLVDDSPDDTRMTLRALRSIVPEVSVSVARDGEEALSLLLGETRLEPELILLDLKMPKIHGFQVLTTLREDDRTRATPVVVFTSSSDPSDIEQARDLGANAFVCKPIDSDEYADAVRQAVATYRLVAVN
jgi:two-component system response regulator